MQGTVGGLIKIKFRKILAIIPHSDFGFISALSLCIMDLSRVLLPMPFWSFN